MRYVGAKGKAICLANRKVRGDFTRRRLVSLHDLKEAGVVEKVGHGRGEVWRLFKSLDRIDAVGDRRPE